MSGEIFIFISRYMWSMIYSPSMWKWNVSILFGIISKIKWIKLHLNNMYISAVECSILNQFAILWTLNLDLSLTFICNAIKRNINILYPWLFNNFASRGGGVVWQICKLKALYNAPTLPQRPHPLAWLRIGLASMTFVCRILQSFGLMLVWYWVCHDL